MENKREVSIFCGKLGGVTLKKDIAKEFFVNRREERAIIDMEVGSPKRG